MFELQVFYEECNQILRTMQYILEETLAGDNMPPSRPSARLEIAEQIHATCKSQRGVWLRRRDLGARRGVANTPGFSPPNGYGV